MESFAPPRRLVDNQRFESDRKNVLEKLVLDEVDAPIRSIVDGFSRLPFCFTLQCCYGHFVHSEVPAPDNLEPLPAIDVGTVTYRIAYLALCIQNSSAGNQLLSELAGVPSINPDLIQFGSPRWFWDRHVNSYALQVEPSRFAGRDQATIDYAEAVQVQKVRDEFYAKLTDLVNLLQN